MKKLRLLFIMFLVLTLALYTKVEAATKEVELGQEKYEVKNGTEYTSRKEIEYIKILSDRSGISRISLEFDLSLIKDYDSTNGIVEYNNLKNKLKDFILNNFSSLDINSNKIVEITKKNANTQINLPKINEQSLFPLFLS